MCGGRFLQWGKGYVLSRMVLMIPLWPTAPAHVFGDKSLGISVGSILQWGEKKVEKKNSTRRTPAPSALGAIYSASQYVHTAVVVMGRFSRWDKGKKSAKTSASRRSPVPCVCHFFCFSDSPKVPPIPAPPRLLRLLGANPGDSP